MNRIAMTLLRTVFLPIGSPPIGSVCEIRADIAKADIHVEKGQVYCMGEIDLLIDYLSFSPDSGGQIFPDQMSAYPKGGGREWQALLNLPFAMNESANLTPGTQYKATLGELKWFMVAPRALEMEMEMIIEGEAAAAPLKEAIKEQKQDGGWKMATLDDMETAGFDKTNSQEKISQEATRWKKTPPAAPPVTPPAPPVVPEEVIPEAPVSPKVVIPEMPVAPELVIPEMPVVPELVIPEMPVVPEEEVIPEPPVVPEEEVIPEAPPEAYEGEAVEEWAVEPETMTDNGIYVCRIDMNTIEIKISGDRRGRVTKTFCLSPELAEKFSSLCLKMGDVIQFDYYINEAGQNVITTITRMQNSKRGSGFCEVSAEAALEPEIVRIVFNEENLPDEAAIKRAIAQAKADAAAEKLKATAKEAPETEMVREVRPEAPAPMAPTVAGTVEKPVEAAPVKKKKNRSIGLPRLDVDIQDSDIDISAFNINIKIP